MSISNLVLDFYQEVFRENIVETKNLMGFKNNQFNNPIMTPNFVLSSDLTKLEIEKQRKQLACEPLWFNCFNEFNPSKISLGKMILQPEYIVEKTTETFISGKERYSYQQSVDDNYLKLVEANSSNLNIVTQKKILSVFELNKANFEFYLCRNRESHIVAGATLIHTRRTTLLINGFVDFNSRGTGLFKRFFNNLRNHCYYRGTQHVFYWTFHPKLKGKSELFQQLSIYQE